MIIFAVERKLKAADPALSAVVSPRKVHILTELSSPPQGIEPTHASTIASGRMESNAIMAVRVILLKRSMRIV